MPIITANGPTSFCGSGSVQLSAPAGFSYLWNTGATTQSITVTTANSYSVRTIAGTCTSANSAATVVTIGTKPGTPTITAKAPTSLCASGSVVLAAPVGFNYIWSNGATTPTITVTQAGNFTVSTIIGSCSSRISTVYTVHPCISGSPAAGSLEGSNSAAIANTDKIELAESADLEDNLSSNTSITTANRVQEINVLPNPTAGLAILRLSQPQHEAYQFRLVNCLGKVIKTISIPTNVSEIELDMVNLATGLYTIEGNGVKAFKIIKQ
jgi:hypothetical protein